MRQCHCSIRPWQKFILFNVLPIMWIRWNFVSWLTSQVSHRRIRMLLRTMKAKVLNRRRKRFCSINVLSKDTRPPTVMFNYSLIMSFIKVEGHSMVAQPDNCVSRLILLAIPTKLLILASLEARVIPRLISGYHEVFNEVWWLQNSSLTSLMWAISYFYPLVSELNFLITMNRLAPRPKNSCFQRLALLEDKCILISSSIGLG